MQDEPIFQTHLTEQPTKSQWTTRETKPFPPDQPTVWIIRSDSEQTWPCGPVLGPQEDQCAVFEDYRPRRLAWTPKPLNHSGRGPSIGFVSCGTPVGLLPRLDATDFDALSTAQKQIQTIALRSIDEKPHLRALNPTASVGRRSDVFAISMVVFSRCRQR
jgi:hypothetical protein